MGGGRVRVPHGERPDAPPAGRLVLHVIAALTEFERNLIRERTTAWLKAARVRVNANKALFQSELFDCTEGKLRRCLHCFPPAKEDAVWAEPKTAADFE